MRLYDIINCIFVRIINLQEEYMGKPGINRGINKRKIGRPKSYIDGEVRYTLRIRKEFDDDLRILYLKDKKSTGGRLSLNAWLINALFNYGYGRREEIERCKTEAEEKLNTNFKKQTFYDDF